jgi:hypothetical protein
MRQAYIILAFVVPVLFFGCRDAPEQQRRDRGSAPTSEVESSDPIERGRIAYENFCASCHGLDGSGNGPVAEYLTVPLNDLRLLKVDHGGTLPVDLIYETIDGRDDVRAHGTRIMPVWGNVWTEVDGTPLPQEVVDTRINELIEYLRSIQVQNIEALQTAPDGDSSRDTVRTDS